MCQLTKDPSRSRRSSRPRRLQASYRSGSSLLRVLPITVPDRGPSYRNNLVPCDKTPSPWDNTPSPWAGPSACAPISRLLPALSFPGVGGWCGVDATTTRSRSRLKEFCQRDREKSLTSWCSGKKSVGFIDEIWLRVFPSDVHSQRPARPLIDHAKGGSCGDNCSIKWASCNVKGSGTAKSCKVSPCPLIWTITLFQPLPRLLGVNRWINAWMSGLSIYRASSSL